MKLHFLMLLLFFEIKLIYACSKHRKNVLYPRMIRIGEDDVQRYRTDDDYKSIRIHVDWSNFDPTVTGTNQQFASALKESIIPRTMNIFTKLIKVRRLITKLNFPNVKKCDMYTVPDYLQHQGVDADIVIYPIIEKTGMFLRERVEAAALYCTQSSLDGRPLMGFIEFRPDLLAGDEYHIDYHIWLALHELTHVFAFNDSLFPSYVDPHTNRKLGQKNVMRSYTVNGMKMNFVVTKKVREMATKHFNCPNAIGVPLENKGSSGTRDGHWNRKAMNGDVMIAKSFGENLISDITLALFEDTGWYQVNYDQSNVFIWGKNRGCDFLYCKDCYREKEVNSKNGLFKVKSNYPREFCSNFNNPVCSTHNIFRGNCEVSEDVMGMENEVKVTPFTQKRFGGVDRYMDYCPSATEEKTDQLYYGGSCRLGHQNNMLPHEKICPNCACVITDLNTNSLKTLAKKKRFKIRMGSTRFAGKSRKVYFKSSPHLRASCMEYNCNDGELNISVLDKSYHCDKRYININGLGVIKCPLKSLVCHPKYRCKFGCVEKYH